MEQSVLQTLWGFPRVFATAEGSEISALLTKQADFSKEAIRQIAEQRDEIASALEQHVVRADNLSTQIDALREVLAKERADSAAAVGTLQNQFAQESRERQEKYQQWQDSANVAFSTMREEATASSAALLMMLEERKREAARIVQVVGNIGITGNYQKIANEERTQANLWRLVTLGLFTLGISIAVSTFVMYWGEPVSKEMLAGVGVRLMYALVIAAPAWYTARESARHRTTSDRARQTELELASLGPFIELMPSDKKIEIREALTKVYFGRTVDEHQVQGLIDPKTVESIVDLIKVAKG
jgi:quinol monooxygenase YgiN